MAANDDRFVRTYKQGGVFDHQIQIWVDKQTGVNYMVMPSGYGMAITPLLNRDGTPVISSVSQLREE